jgi:hypothetical protein
MTKHELKAKYPTLLERVFLAVGDGWLPLLDDLFGKIIEADPEAKVLQVKEKFGGLRVYTSSAVGVVSEAAMQAEGKSYTICQDCGAPGREQTIRGWINTLCDDCAAKRSHK